MGGMVTGPCARANADTTYSVFSFRSATGATFGGSLARASAEEVLKLRRPARMEWRLDVSRHAARRMSLRRLGEVDLRIMLDSVRLLRSDFVEGRWIASARHERRQWEIILEPDHELRVLVVVTAYPADF